MPRDDHRLDETAIRNRNAAEELDSIVRHSAASNGFGAPEVALGEIGAEPRERGALCQTVLLARDELLCLRDGRGAVLRLHDGVAWLTQERAARDVVLREGESFRLDRDGLALVEALRDATITVSAGARALAPGFEILHPIPSTARPMWPGLVPAFVAQAVESWLQRFRVGWRLLPPARRLMCRS